MHVSLRITSYQLLWTYHMDNISTLIPSLVCRHAATPTRHTPENTKSEKSTAPKRLPPSIKWCEALQRITFKTFISIAYDKPAKWYTCFSPVRTFITCQLNTNKLLKECEHWGLMGADLVVKWITITPRFGISYTMLIRALAPGQLHLL